MSAEKTKEDPFEVMHKHLIENLHRFLNDDDLKGVEISSLIRVLANVYSAAITQDIDAGDLSGPRMGILLRLMVSEESGMTQGIRPTQLSHFQHVKKNTISSLLRGLEENGLVERLPDPEDKRGFMIRITQAGKDKIKKIGPRRLKLINELASGLDADEKTQLIRLLEKLRKSIRENTNFSAHPQCMDIEKA